MSLDRTTALRLLAGAAWIVTTVTTGAQIDDASAAADSGARWFVAIGAWAVWGATALGLAVRHPVALTVVRLGSLVGVTAAFVAAAASDPGAGDTLAAVVPPLVTAGVAASRSFGESWIDGASYGDERRFMLRAPLGLQLGPIPLALVLVAAGAVTGPALLLDGRTVAGVIVTVVGIALAALAGRAVHTLHRRWLVFVPAGVVVHDHMTTREPFLMIHGQIADVDAAPADYDITSDEVHDGTGHAPGLVVEISLDKPVELVRRPAGGGIAEAVTRRSIAVVPTRPLGVVEEFRTRRARRRSPRA